jgi:hypothetical protein
LFEVQRFIGDFTSENPSVAREARTLHAVLRSSALELPVLLLMGSSPDYQAALGRRGAESVGDSDGRRHLIARRLAQRDLTGALELVREVPADDLVIPDLAEYLAFAVRKSRVQPATGPSGAPSGGQR